MARKKPQRDKRQAPKPASRKPGGPEAGKPDAGPRKTAAVKRAAAVGAKGRKRAAATASDGPAPASAPAYQISQRVVRQALAKPYRWKREGNKPLSRPLWIYTLDPSLSDRDGGVAKVEVPWEPLQPGPRGQLFEVIGGGAPEPLAGADAPLDLDDPRWLISDGVAPSPSNAQFHLQMTYAVCSLTYAAFRRALGRDIGWAFDPEQVGHAGLRVRPFAFAEANAGYSREAGDLSFGYFRAGVKPAGFTVPGGLVFTSLSHDVIAHETTHALLDGLRASFQEPTNVDVLAFHEGFADLVALFLHFTYPGVVEGALRQSRGVVERGSVLAAIAREFGHARSPGTRAEALRGAIDVAGIQAFDSDVVPGTATGPVTYDEAKEPHELGTVLVSAVFEAFVTITRRKTARLMQIAGHDPQLFGKVPLADALLAAVAKETSDVAAQFLTMSIRAIDYCPPVDMLLGEYLRALVTADAEVEPTDKWGYREALMRSFRRRHIFPTDVEFMTEDAVRWKGPETELVIPGLAFRDLRFDGEPGRPAGVKELERQANALGRFVTDPAHAPYFRLLPLTAPPPEGVVQVSPTMVESIRVARRAAPDGRILFDTVAEVTQACTVKLGGDLVDQTGGCTIVINQEGAVRYTIAKGVTSRERRDRQAKAMRGPLKGYWHPVTTRGEHRLRACPDTLALVHAAKGG